MTTGSSTIMKLASVLIAGILLFGCLQAPGGAQATEKPIGEIVKEDIATPGPIASAKTSVTPIATTQATASAEPTTEAAPTSQPAANVQASTTTVPIAAMQEFTVEIDDSGWYPSSIAVKKGVPVKLTMKMREQNVYFAGGDLKSDVFNELGVGAGQTRVREFTPDRTFKVSNIWPNNGVWKGDLTVNVE